LNGVRVAINRGSIEIVKGDLADEETGAVVNAANNQFWMGGGVAGALKRRGGDAIEKEAMAQGPVTVGEAVLTGGGSLKAKHVIHAAVMGQDLHTNEACIRSATLSALRIAEQQGIRSLSFPALGTGIGGFPLHHCAKIMLGEAVSFLSAAAHPHDVRFVLFDEEAYGAFEAELRLQFSSKRH
jgi:O-acetyl-ADP-ribose deacetylase (regulator of RNase III)